MTTTEVNIRMSASEMIVAGLAVAVLMTGLAAGVLAKQAPTSRHVLRQGPHFVDVQARDRN